MTFPTTIFAMMVADGVDPDAIARITDLIAGDADPLDVEATAAWERQCYHRPSDNDLILHAADVLLDNFGVEGWTIGDSMTEGVSYSNTGDMYAPTLALTPDGWRWADYETLATSYPAEGDPHA